MSVSRSGDSMTPNQARSASMSSDQCDLEGSFDDVSEMDSINSYSTYSRIKRQPLIIIHAAEVNKCRIRAEVAEHLPTPEKILEDDTFTSAAFPALYRRNTHRVDSFGHMTPPHSPKKLNESQHALRPAPFLKTKSRSRILHAHGMGEEQGVQKQSLERADSSNIVVGIARAHLLQRHNTRNNYSQRFNVRREDSTISALQSHAILDSRYRGWGPTEPSVSSKHDNSTNFY